MNSLHGNIWEKRKVTSAIFACVRSRWFKKISAVLRIPLRRRLYSVKTTCRKNRIRSEPSHMEIDRYGSRTCIQASRRIHAGPVVRGRNRTQEASKSSVDLKKTHPADWAAAPGTNRPTVEMPLGSQKPCTEDLFVPVQHATLAQDSGIKMHCVTLGRTQFPFTGHLWGSS